MKVEYSTEDLSVLCVSIVTFAIGAYDSVIINKYLKNFASHKHRSHVLLSTAVYALFNGLSAVFSKDKLLLGGVMALARIYYIRSMMLFQMSYCNLDGHGGVDEMISVVGSLLSKKDAEKNQKWVRRRVNIVNMWLILTFIIFVCRSVTDAYGKHVVIQQIENLGPRMHFWNGAFFYLAVIGIMLDIACGIAQKQLGGAISGMGHPKMQHLGAARQKLFVFYYLIVTIWLAKSINLIFAAHINVDNEQYRFWNVHGTTFIAAVMLPFQYVSHRYYLPPYSWGWGLEVLKDVGAKVKTREDVNEYLRRHDIHILASQDDEEADLEITDNQEEDDDVKQQTDGVEMPELPPPYIDV